MSDPSEVYFTQCKLLFPKDLLWHDVLKHNYQNRSQPYSLVKVIGKINFSTYYQEILWYWGQGGGWPNVENNVCSLS